MFIKHNEVNCIRLSDFLLLYKIQWKSKKVSHKKRYFFILILSSSNLCILKEFYKFKFKTNFRILFVRN